MFSYIFMKTYNQRTRLQTHQKRGTNTQLLYVRWLPGSQHISWNLLQFSHISNTKLETSPVFPQACWMFSISIWNRDESWQCFRRQQTWFWSPLGNTFWLNTQSLLKYIHYSIGDIEILLLFANFSLILFQLLVLHSQKTLFTIIRTISKLEVARWPTARMWWFGRCSLVGLFSTCV